MDRPLATCSMGVTRVASSRNVKFPKKGVAYMCVLAGVVVFGDPLFFESRPQDNQQGPTSGIIRSSTRSFLLNSMPYLVGACPIEIEVKRRCSKGVQRKCQNPKWREHKTKRVQRYEVHLTHECKSNVREFCLISGFIILHCWGIRGMIMGSRRTETRR